MFTELVKNKYTIVEHVFTEMGNESVLKEMLSA
jgi:hypothetical protein